MNLKPLAANMTEVEVNGIKVLFSYKTPVAYIKTYKDGGMIVRKTNKFWSRTTTRHINKWLGTLNHCECDQTELDNLLNEVK